MVATITTGADGTATSTALPAGTYTVVETAAPAGYELDTVPHEAIILPPWTLTFADAPLASPTPTGTPSVGSSGTRSALPATGEPVPVGLLLLGPGLLLLGAAALALTRRRSSPTR